MKDGKKKRKLFIILGILIIFLLFFLIETINPYNFLEDDNAAYFLPMVLEGMQQVFSGHLPSINLHQLMGTKILETGTHSVFYPITIISYFFAHYIFSNDFLLFDIFVLIHLILGFIFSFIFLNLHSKKNLVSFLGAFAFVFSGYAIGLSRAWNYVIPVILFLPLIFYLNDKLSTGNKKSIILLGIVRGIFFYAGNAQYFIFALFFEFVYFFIREYQNGWKDFLFKIKNYLFSLFISLIIFFPLLFAQIQVSLNSYRGDIPLLKYIFSRGALPTDTFVGIIIFPQLLAWLPSLFKYSSVSYSGTLFSLLFFAGGIYLINKYRNNSFKKINPLFWCGLISMILSWGIFGFFYSVGGLIPILKNFEGPFKFIIFTNFFMISFGAIIFSRLLETNRIKKGILFIIILLFSILLISNVFFLSQKSESNYFDKLPLNKSYFEEIGIKDYRVVSVATGSDFSPKISSELIKIPKIPESHFLSKNFATYFLIDHISGYETFMDKITAEKIPVFREGISNRHLNLTTLQEYGVKYIVIFKEGLNFHSELINLKKIYEKEDFIILELPEPKGYVFYRKDDLNYDRLYNGFYFQTDFERYEDVTINLLYKEGYVCKVNGQKIDIFQDDLGRMVINIPKGKNEISFLYLPKDFIFGCIISLVLILILIILFIFRKHIGKLISNISFNGFFRFLSKNKGKIMLLIIIFSIFFIFISILGKSNIEMSFESKFGIKLEIGNIKWGANKVVFQDIKTFDGSKIKFYSSEIAFKIDYKKSFHESLSNKKLLIFFNSISVENVSAIFINKNSEFTSCDLPLNISNNLSPENINLFNLYKDDLSINNAYFSVPNKFVFSLNEEVFNLSSDKLNKTLNITANLTLGRYVSGNIILENPSSQKTKQSCLILPIDKKSSLFY